MTSDMQGNEVTNANRESLDAYEQAVAAFNLYHGDPIALLDRALAVSPDFPMAHIAKALMLALSSEPAAFELATSQLSTAHNLKMNSRERSLFDAARMLSSGHWVKAAQMLNLHNMYFPRDLLALQTGHLLDFYCADSRNMRERIARAMPLWSEQMPGYSVVLGMYAFGLEEDGHYAQAEDTGRNALTLEPLDCWAHHAVALEMVDASALLWRLHLCNVDVGDRWKELAQVWRNHADGKTYPFNDWHAAMAFLGAGLDSELSALIKRMRQSAADSPCAEWINRIGLPLVQGFTAFWLGNDGKAVEILLPVRHFCGVFGGSHAQRDIIDLTLIEAASRGGAQDIHQSLVNERLAQRPYSRMTAGFLNQG